MPSAWSLIESSFPSFSGDERVRDQLAILIDYMYMLSEGLKYQLTNLSSDNFNTKALQDIQIETTADVENALAEVLFNLESLNSSLSALRGKVSYLEEWQGNAVKQLIDLSVAQRQQEKRLSDLASLIHQEQDGSIVVGSEGAVIRLVGDVYVNGILLDVTTDKEE